MLSLADIASVLTTALSSFTTLSLPVLSASLFALYYTTSAIYSHYRLRHIPGPWLASFSYLWLMRVNYLGISAHTLVQLTAKYGPVVRIAPNYILTTDVSALRRISAPRSAYTRDAWWEGLRTDPTEAGENMLTTMDNGAHDARKAKTASGYSGKDGVDIEGKMDEQVDRLKALIRRKYIPAQTESKSGEKVDLAWLIRYFTLDSITALAYGESFGYLQAGGDLYGFNAQLADMTVAVAVMLNTPVMRWLVRSPLGSSMMPRATDKMGMGRLIGIGRERVKAKFEAEKDGRGEGGDMVSSFMRHGLSQTQCEAECQVQIIAGAETTGTTLRTAFLHILSTPRIYTKLMREINDAIESGLIDKDAPVTYQQAKKLPYLQAVIYESLRFRPPALYSHFKSAPPAGDTIASLFIPGGTAVGHNIFGILMSPAIFGSDPEVFRPERFLEASAGGAEGRAGMERTIELAFGSGRWLCAGKHVAFTQLCKVIVEVLREFEMEFASPAGGSGLWMEDSAVFWRQRGLWVRFREREV